MKLLALSMLMLYAADEGQQQLHPSMGQTSNSSQFSWVGLFSEDG